MWDAGWRTGGVSVDIIPLQLWNVVYYQALPAPHKLSDKLGQRMFWCLLSLNQDQKFYEFTNQLSDHYYSDGGLFVHKGLFSH